MKPFLFSKARALLLVGSLSFLLYADQSGAEKAWKEGEWRKAASMVDSHLLQNPQDMEALLLRIQIAISEKDFAEAERHLQRAFDCGPVTARLYDLQGQFFLDKKEYTQSLSALQKGEELDGEWFEIPLLKTWVYLSMGNLKEAQKALERASSLSSPSGALEGAWGYLAFRQYKAKKSQEHFQSALQKDPLHRLSHAYLGGGMGIYNTNENLKKDTKSFEKLQEALQSLEEKKYPQSLHLLQGLLKEYPGNATLHFLIAETLKRRDYSRHRISFLPPFQKLSTYSFSPPLEEKLFSQFFTHYQELTPLEKRILQYSMAPVEKYIPHLLGKKIHHYLLPLETRISEIKGMERFQHRYGVDGRRKGDVRGLSERNAITGRECLMEAGSFAFNTVAHEVAHQIHVYCLSEAEEEEIEQMYEKALQEKRCLDFYAASNSKEYFAQGYEAFVSRYKRPGLGMTANHTRDELKERDPALYRFLKKTCQNPLDRFKLAEMYYRIGKVQEALQERKEARRSFERATYLALGMMEDD